MTNNLEIIAAADLNNGIGKNGGLLARLSPDLKRLRAMTVGNIAVMGSRTYLSFPVRPLPDRENVVLTSRPERFPEAKCFSSAEEFLEYAGSACRPVFVLGGGEVYRLLLPFCSKVHLTRILYEFEGADTFFPDIDSMPDWKKLSQGETINTEKYPFRYDEYVRA